MSLGAQHAAADHTRFGAALSHNISMSGALVTTNHPLVVGDQVEVAIPTRHCPASLSLPEEVQGTAEVRRVETREHESRRVALAFAENMQRDLEFALFMAYVAGQSESQTRH